MKHLTITLLTLLMSMGAWALEKEDAIELTCNLTSMYGEDSFSIQLHLSDHADTSWFRLLRKSNEDLYEKLKRGERSKIGSVGQLFIRYRKRDVDTYFDVPHFRITDIFYKPDFISVHFKAITKSFCPECNQYIRINRSTGEAVKGS
tara:strand:- start:429 stop:869 length:441 start_codon:yes stop_codon:yes gene_type:complete